MLAAGPETSLPWPPSHHPTSTPQRRASGENKVVTQRKKKDGKKARGGGRPAREQSGTPLSGAELRRLWPRRTKAAAQKGTLWVPGALWPCVASPRSLALHLGVGVFSWEASYNLHQGVKPHGGDAVAVQWPTALACSVNTLGSFWRRRKVWVVRLREPWDLFHLGKPGDWPGATRAAVQDFPVGAASRVIPSPVGAVSPR